MEGYVAPYPGLRSAIRLFDLAERTVRTRSRVFAHDHKSEGRHSGRCNIRRQRSGTLQLRYRQELSLRVWSAVGCRLSDHSEDRVSGRIWHRLQRHSEQQQRGWWIGRFQRFGAGIELWHSRDHVVSRHSHFIPARAVAELRSGIFPNRSQRQHRHHSFDRSGLDGPECRSARAASSVEHWIPA